MDINPTNMVVKENDISSPSSGRASYTSEDYDDDNNNTKTTKKAGTRTTTHFDEHIYSNAFRTANSIVVKTLGTKCYASGTTAVTALFGKDNIVRFGNVGDSRIICAMSDSDVMTRHTNSKAVPQFLHYPIQLENICLKLYFFVAFGYSAGTRFCFCSENVFVKFERQTEKTQTATRTGKSDLFALCVISVRVRVALCVGVCVCV